MESLGDRMKEYEAVTTETVLVPNVPVYIGLDGRTFHTFCHGLDKPFDMDFVEVMKETAKYLHDKTGATISYVQSDEISLGYLNPTQIPFERRLFKLQSVFAGMASSKFTIEGLKTKMRDRILKYVPHFDCRVCQMPEIDLAAMFLFRANDCRKNSVTMVALSKFSHKRLQKVRTEEKIKMLKEEGIDYDRDIPENLRFGSYFRKMVYEKELTPEEIEKIPVDKRHVVDGKMTCTRSKVDEVFFGSPLNMIANRPEVLFHEQKPIFLTDVGVVPA